MHKDPSEKKIHRCLIAWDTIVTFIDILKHEGISTAKLNDWDRRKIYLMLGEFIFISLSTQL
jgi:hypothetical protein